MPISVGIDLVRADEVRGSLSAYGDRYVQRIYTEGEQRDCRGDVRCLAARFAAKEATLKALDYRDEPVPWRSIAVGRETGGRPCLRLSGQVAAVAHSRGLKRLDLSLTQAAEVSGAIVLAELGETP